ncbi:class I SAM-dependent methyltransferase [Brucella pseudogrignonensis]|uniref:class I SAM-dependent methyltransferase n=1 Tax=Brucella pseudogrignonensis TaxID=419475 RepID=UPI00190DC150|nr:class I SAM-dependent methyltransferase [Brucella pseudogrignonensis]MBK0024053.1 class I SAM-dependent methyltransferase [Ochrobactrum sp. S45]MBK0045796.1 class I SAM-dependent methyltransferase [Ochrobactrum sp. S46]UKK94447.1 class I SAM-dependent methyltransferase [Brucella pseudogrignonensis]
MTLKTLIGNLASNNQLENNQAKEQLTNDGRGIDYSYDIQKGVEVCKSILSSADGLVFDRDWILDRIKAFGLAYQDWSLMENFNDWRNTSHFGLQQFPTEFADFLVLLAKTIPKNGVEIGVWRGASSYFMCAVLQRITRDYEHTMIDISDYVFGFDDFNSILNLNKKIPNTSTDFRGTEFDFVFIDADHSYDGASTDYLNLGRYAKKIVAYHDIHAHEYDHLNGGTVRAWREFKAANANKMSIMEFAHSPTPWMGIGVGLKNSKI